MEETTTVVYTTTIPWIWIIISIIFGLAVYIFTSYCLMKMAERIGTPNGWLAFIPFAQYWLFAEMGDKPTSWFVLMLIFSFCCPLVTMILLILIMMEVAKKIGFEDWWGILIIIPIFNFYVFYKLAFMQPEGR